MGVTRSGPGGNRRAPFAGGNRDPRSVSRGSGTKIRSAHGAFGANKFRQRIGRTGLAQNVGDAFTLMSGHELSALQAIEHFIAQKIPRLKLDNFPYLYTALFEPESGTSARRAVGGGRRHRGYSFGRRR